MSRQGRFDWFASQIFRRSRKRRTTPQSKPSPLSRRLRLEALEDRQMLSVNFTGTYSQDFNSLVTTGISQPWVNDTTLAGWSLLRQPGLGTAITAIHAGDGSVATGTFYSLGTATNPERALGGIGSGGAYFGSPASGSTAGWIALAMANDTDATIDDLYLNYTGEQWRDGGNATAQTMVFEYGFGVTFDAVSTWTAQGGTFDFTSPIHTATAAALNGNATPNRTSGRGGVLASLDWNVGETLWFRWIETNDVGNDHGLAIDDLEVTTTLVVDTLTDENDGIFVGTGTSLREAIAASAPGGTIEFSVSGGILLSPSLGQLVIDKSLTISNVDRDTLSVIGNGDRVFNIDDGTPAEINVVIQGVTITGGEVAGDGGGIRSTENLTIRESLITGNRTLGGVGYVYYGLGTVGNPGGNGGGLWASGTTILEGTEVTFNSTGSGADGQSGAVNQGGYGGDGGGIWSSGTLTISDTIGNLSRIHNNVTGAGGRGGDNFDYHPITGNGGRGGNGGGIWSSGATTITGTGVFDNQTGAGGNGGDEFNPVFSYGPGQGGLGGAGGGLYAVGAVTITNSGFDENRTGNGGSGGINPLLPGDQGGGGAGGDGGGIWANNGGGSLTVANSVFTGNGTGLTGAGWSPVDPGQGGGIISAGLTTITDSTISGNFSRSLGGGIAAGLVGTGNVTTITDSIITFNSATYGGGVRVSGDTSISGSTIGDNHSIEHGGGIDSHGLLTIDRSTIAYNTTDNEGGGFYLLPGASTAGSSIHNTIVSNNTVDATSAPSDITGAVSATYSLVGVDDTATITDNGGNLIGSLAAPLDALLGESGLNGGSWLTYALLPGSPAINAGDPSFLSPPDFDHRGAGFPRVSGGRIDIGALEVRYNEVDTLSDIDDGNYSDGNLSLREAITLANVYGNEIITFSPLLNGGTILLTNGQLPAIEKNVAITGPGANLLTIDASGNDPTPSTNNGDGSRIFNIDDGFTSFFDPLLVSISGLTLTGGDTNGSGGAIRSTESLTLTDTVLTGNSSTNFGGAIFLLAEDGATQTLSGVTISGNAAQFGGGIHSVIEEDGTVEVLDSTITGNTASDSGGGIRPYFQGGGTFRIESSTISDNVANTRGGGVAAGRNGSGVPSLEILASTVSGNTAGLDSGGVYISGGTLQVTTSTIDDNQASSGKGGGIGTNGTAVSILSSTISNNRARTNGGGIDNFGGSLLVTSSTISGNSLSGFPSTGGAGISSSVHPFIYHSTITDNFSSAGVGGINAAGVTIDHTIVAGNDGPGSNDDIFGSTSATYSLIGNNAGSGLAATPDGVPDANGNLVGPAYFQSTFEVSVQMAAMGDFENGLSVGTEDRFLFEYQIDGGAWLPLFTSSVDENDTQTYLLSTGPSIQLDDPLLMNGIKLDNIFRTQETTISAPGSQLQIRFVGTSEGGAEAFAWRNLSVVRRLPNGTGTTIGRAVHSSGDLFDLFVQSEPDYAPGSDDMFGVRTGDAAGLPDAIVDLGGGDTQGIIVFPNTNRFFGVVDTVNPPDLFDTHTATWTFANVTSPIDPRLASLDDNGGPTRTHALLAGSPAIDSGDPAYAGPLTTDQRGTPFGRVADGGVNSARSDMGAYERQTVDSSYFVVTTTVDEVDYSNSYISLREALNWAHWSAGPETISFDPVLFNTPQTIILNMGELLIRDELTITGPGANLLTIDASGNDPTPTLKNGDGSRIFNIEDGLSTLMNVSILGVTLTGGDSASHGGAIYSAENTTIASSTLAGNSSAQYGGAILNTSGVLTILNSTLSGNSAFLGGGIWSYTAVSQVSRIDNSTISNNSASGHGGGVDNAGGEMDIISSTITLNEAPNGEGSGVSAHGTRTSLSNSIVAGNINSDIDNISGTSIQSDGYNLVGTGNAVSIFNATGDQVGVNPLLGPLADNGGPTLTHRLFGGSPAINAGEPSIPFTVGEFDQRGFPFSRVSNGRIDIGAYEYQVLSLVVDTTDDIDNGDYSPGDLSLREAAKLAYHNPELDTISFDASLNGQTITLDQGQINIADLVIGPGANLLTINGGGTSRIFNTEYFLRIDGLTMENGLEVGNNANANDNSFSGGAIRSTTLSGLQVYNSIIRNSRTEGDFADGGAVYALGQAEIVNSSITGNSTKEISADGGGVFVGGNLTMTGSTVSNNSTLGYGARGGGLFLTGSATITGSLIDGNSTSGNESQGSGLISLDTTVITDTDITNNTATGNNHRGGGIFSNSSLHITGGSISGNMVTGSSAQGGGIFGNGIVTLDSATVSGNTAAFHGGGLFVIGQLTLESTAVSNNSGFDGGGVWNLGTTMVADSAITGNTAGRDGGGLYLRTSSGADTVEIRDSTINGNSANSNAGGLWVELNAGGSAIIERITLDNNQSTFDGGGIWARGNTTIANSTVSGNNSSHSGGGLYLRTDTLSHAILVTNSTISGNVANRDAGGVFVNPNGGGPVTIQHSTITDNESDADNDSDGTGGGVIIPQGTLTLENSIVAFNRGTVGKAPDLGTIGTATGSSVMGTVLSSYSLIGDNFGAGLAEAQSPDANGNLIGQRVVLGGSGLIDPKLGILADNGGPTFSHTLLAGSTALDAGDPAFIAPPNFDQRGSGFDRVRDGNGDTVARIDIGAFEVQTAVVIPSADFDQDGDIDGRDFLAWQRGYGIIPPNAVKTDGDADNDTDVDGEDLSVWQGQYGTTPPLVAALGIADSTSDVSEQSLLPTHTNDFSVANYQDAVDAAMAMSLLQHGGEDLEEAFLVDPIADEVHPFDSTFETNYITQLVFDSEDSNSYYALSRRIDAPELDLEWLSEGLMERVFG